MKRIFSQKIESLDKKGADELKKNFGKFVDDSMKVEEKDWVILYEGFGGTEFPIDCEIIIRNNFRKKIKGIDNKREYKGFIYLLWIKDRKGKYNYKLGCTKNLIMRLGEHIYVTFEEVRIRRVSHCFDYLKCEAEMKKFTYGKEIFSEEKTFHKVNKIIDKYENIPLSIGTVSLIIPSVENYFNKKQKNGS